MAYASAYETRAELMEGGAGGTDDEHECSDADEYDDDGDDYDDDAETEAEPYEEAIVRRDLPEAPFSEVDGVKLHLVTSKDKPTSTGNTQRSRTTHLLICALVPTTVTRPGAGRDHSVY